MKAGVVIVRGGHAGAQAALTLRQSGYQEAIEIIAAEDELPYERPPLSKDYLAGTIDRSKLLLRPKRIWIEKNVGLSLGRTVVAVDPARRAVRADDGTERFYRHLIWAAGGTPRGLDCAQDDTGAHVVRSVCDVDRLRGELVGGKKKIVVVGGGYIGLETAAVFAQAEHEVVVLEAEDRLLARVTGTDIAAFYLEQHRAQGVDVRLKSKVQSVARTETEMTEVVLENGERIECHIIVVGIGIIPNAGPLHAAGAEGRNGILVDGNCKSSLPDVFAIGDCAEHVNVFGPKYPIRVESIQNANDMAKVVALSICGKPEPYGTLPWFWSNQYDLKLQTAGLNAAHDQVLVRGQPADRSSRIFEGRQNNRDRLRQCNQGLRSRTKTHREKSGD